MGVPRLGDATGMISGRLETRRSTVYPQARQSSSDLFQSNFGNLSAVKIKILKFGQPLQMCQPRVSDLSTAEGEDGEIAHSFQMEQPVIGNQAASEVEVG